MTKVHRRTIEIQKELLLVCDQRELFGRLELREHALDEAAARSIGVHRRCEYIREGDAQGPECHGPGRERRALVSPHQPHSTEREVYEQHRRDWKFFDLR